MPSVFLMRGHSHAFSSNGSFTLLVSHSHRTAGRGWKPSCYLLWGCRVQYGVEVEVCGGGGDALSDVSAIRDLQAHSGDSLFSALITSAYSHVGYSLQGGVGGQVAMEMGWSGARPSVIGLEDVAYILHSTEKNHKRRRDRRAPQESSLFQQLFSHGLSESERATQILALHQSVSRFRLITASDEHVWTANHTQEFKCWPWNWIRVQMWITSFLDVKYSKNCSEFILKIIVQHKIERNCS